MLDLPPPPAFGFPTHFATWRQDQLRAIQLITEPREGARATALTMSTGSGKSLVNIAGAVLYGGLPSSMLDRPSRVGVLTSTKALEDQYYHDFNELGLVDVRGMNSYPCLQPFDLSDPVQCDEGPCRYGHKCGKREGGCLYYDAVKSALQSRLLVTNYAYWLSSYNYGQGLGHFDMLVMDEAHDTPDELGKFLSVTISEHDRQIIGSKGPTGSEPGIWGEWAKTWYGNVAARLERQPSSSSRHERNHHRGLRRVLSILDRLRRMNALDWVADTSSHFGDITFDVIDPSQYKELLFRGIPRLVLTSATLRPKTLSLLGLSSTETESWECPSRFPVERRPILHLTGDVIKVRVDAKMSDGMKRVWVGNIDQIIEQYLHHKGIIHTVSYARAKEIFAMSKWKEFMITHDSSSTLKAVAEFRKRPAPAILVSPSVMTGWDFPEDDCRWQIIAKIPMPDSRVPVVKARQDRDPEYGPYLAMRSLVQASGRGMRSSTDWCVTFITDDHASWFVQKYRHLAPNWFHRALRHVNQLPPTIEF